MDIFTDSSRSHIHFRKWNEKGNLTRKKETLPTNQKFLDLIEQTYVAVSLMHGNPTVEVYSQQSEKDFLERKGNFSFVRICFWIGYEFTVRYTFEPNLTTMVENYMKGTQDLVKGQRTWYSKKKRDINNEKDYEYIVTRIIDRIQKFHV